VKQKNKAANIAIKNKGKIKYMISGHFAILLKQPMNLYRKFGDGIISDAK
jgi:hypothetical protein